MRRGNAVRDCPRLASGLRLTVVRLDPSNLPTRAGSRDLLGEQAFDNAQVQLRLRQSVGGVRRSPSQVLVYTYTRVSTCVGDRLTPPTIAFS